MIWFCLLIFDQLRKTILSNIALSFNQYIWADHFAFYIYTSIEASLMVIISYKPSMVQWSVIYKSNKIISVIPGGYIAVPINS